MTTIFSWNKVLFQTWPFWVKLVNLHCNQSHYTHCYTSLYNIILRISRNLLETRENIKISTHPFYHTNLDWFSWEWTRKKNQEKHSKSPTQKNWNILKSPILDFFFRKFHRLILGLVKLIDVKGLDVAQPIWLSGCLI